jgi:hypothetical protein
MNKRGVTKDELFMKKLYELSFKEGVCTAVDRYVIGNLIGQNDKGIDTIVRHLAQANFIKKTTGNFCILTTQGEELVENFLT